VKFTALLQAPFCSTRATPLTALEATAAKICVLLQPMTSPLVLPNQTTPLPCEVPNPLPLMVTTDPGPPEFGLTLATCRVLTENGNASLMTPFCRTRAEPVVDPDATVATICVSLQLCTTPLEAPSHTWPLPCVAPKPEPLIVTCVPGTPLDGEAYEMVVVFTLNWPALDVS